MSDIEYKEKKMVEFERVTPIYTGGGIYVFQGKISGGNFFIACDSNSYYDVIEIDTDPDKIDPNDLWQNDFIEAHTVKEYSGKKARYTFHKSMYNWIIKNRPQGNGCNYSIGDIEEMLQELRLNKIFE